MKAMVLTAGLGTRLRPLTLERAKPAVPILGEPLVRRLLRTLVSQGMNDFRLNLHHLPETITTVFENWKSHGASVSFSHEPEILGTAGGLKNNQSFFDSGTFVMANGDIIAEFSLAEAVAFHKEREALATLLLYPQSRPFAYYPVRIDNQGRFHDFKGVSQCRAPTAETYVFSGIHILEPKIFDFIPPGRSCEINDTVYPTALQSGKRVYGFPVTGYWNDVGNPKSYLQAHQDLVKLSHVESSDLISGTASVARTAAVTSDSVIGPGCILETDTSVEHSVIWDHVRVKRGIRIRNCVVGADVVVDRDYTNKVVTRNGERALE